jgi:hypothetical protein
MFWRNISPPSSWQRINRAEKSVKAGGKLSHLFHSGFLFSLFFDPEDGGDMFVRNIGLLSTDYTTLFPRRQNSSQESVFSEN